MWETQVRSLCQKIFWRRKWLCLENPGREESDSTERLHFHFGLTWVAQRVKSLPAIQETRVQSLGLEDPLEEGMATLSSILAWRIPIDSGTWLATVHGVAESDMTEWLHFHVHFYITRQIHNWASFPLWPRCFILSGAISSCPPLFPSSISNTFWLGQGWVGHVLVPYLFIQLMGSHRKYSGVVCQSLPQGTTFCQNSPLWPVRLGWPCMAGLIASLTYASPFAMTRQWSVKDLVEP